MRLLRFMTVSYTISYINTCNILRIDLCYNDSKPTYCIHHSAHGEIVGYEEDNLELSDFMYRDMWRGGGQ